MGSVGILFKTPFLGWITLNSSSFHTRISESSIRDFSTCNYSNKRINLFAAFNPFENSTDSEDVGLDKINTTDLVDFPRAIVSIIVIDIINIYETIY